MSAVFLSGVGVQTSVPIVTKFGRRLEGHDAVDIEREREKEKEKKREREREKPGTLQVFS